MARIPETELEQLKVEVSVQRLVDASRAGVTGAGFRSSVWTSVRTAQGQSLPFASSTRRTASEALTSPTHTSDRRRAPRAGSNRPALNAAASSE